MSECRGFAVPVKIGQFSGFASSDKRHAAWVTQLLETADASDADESLPQLVDGVDTAAETLERQRRRLVDSFGAVAVS